MSTIPVGLCQCGCGRETTSPRKTDRKNGRIAGVPNRFVIGHGIRARGADHHAWVGGRVVLSGGYIGLYMPEIAYPNSHGYVYEHRVIAEKALGKPLPPNAQVHHVDLDRQNNRNDNLVVCQDEAYHVLLHQRLDALLACGDPNARCCMYCGKYDHQEDMTVFQRRTRRGEEAYHRRCGREAQAKMRSQRTNLSPDGAHAAIGE